MPPPVSAVASALVSQPPLDSRAGAYVVFGSYLSHVICLGTLYTFTLYVIPFQDSFGIPKSAAALPGSMACGLMLALGPITGRLVDKFDARVVEAVTGACVAGGLLCSSYAETFSLLICSHLLLGIGMSGAPSSISLVQSWFSNRRRGLATGLALTGSGTGNVLFAFMIPWMMDSDINDFSRSLTDSGSSDTIDLSVAGTADVDRWRNAMRTQAIVAALVLLPAALLMRKRPIAASIGPAAAEKTPVGTMDTACSIAVDERVDLVAPPDAVPVASVPLSTLLCSRPVLVLFLCKSIASWGYLVPFTFMKPFLTEKFAASDEDAAVVVALFGLCGILGRIVMNMLADRFPRARVLQCSLTLMAISCVCWPHFETVWLTASFVVAPYGLLSGSYIGIPPAITGQFYGEHDAMHLSQLVGMCWLADAVGTTCGPPAAGALIDASGSYTLPGTLTACSLLCAAASLCLLPSPQQWATIRQGLGAKNATDRDVDVKNQQDDLRLNEA